jgi:hypothetical protein
LDELWLAELQPELVKLPVGWNLDLLTWVKDIR